MTDPADTAKVYDFHKPGKPWLEDDPYEWAIHIKHGDGGWTGPRVGIVRGARSHDEAISMFCQENYLSQDDAAKFIAMAP